MRTERFTFTGAGGDELAARLDLPVGEPIAYALFAHCFTCSKDVHAVRRVARGLAAHGFGVLRFDFTGLGDSGGEFAETSFSSNVADLVAAANHLGATRRAPQLLIGHSLGGAAVISAAAELDSIEAVVTIAAPAQVDSEMRKIVGPAVPELEQRGEARVTIAGRSFTVKKQLIEDLEAKRVTERARALRCALLILHSPVDEVVSIDHARALFEAARHPKSFVSLDGANHLLSRHADAAFAADIIAAWARRHVSVPEVESTEHGEVLVRGGADGGYLQEIVAGPHHLSADEPKDVGGTDLGPTPYDLVLAGLGACTSMTLRMYANRKQWPLELVEVRLSHDHVHAKDCEDCESETGRVAVIEREVAIRGDLDDEQRARLLEIADKCPVHKTLSNEIKIRTKAG